MLASILGLLLLLLVVTHFPITPRLKREGNWNLNSTRDRSNDAVMSEIKEVSSPMNLIVQINSRMPSLEEGAPVYEGRQFYSEYNGSDKTYTH